VSNASPEKELRTEYCHPVPNAGDVRHDHKDGEQDQAFQHVVVPSSISD
jgi:hypothetical protein